MPSRKSSGMRFAYADPPYPGQALRHYKHHADFDGEVDHGALIERLMDEFADGWALSTSEAALKDVLELVPRATPSRKNKGRYLSGTGVRILAWIKPQSAWMPTNPQYCWEPVLLYGGRRTAGRPPIRNYLICSPQGFTFRPRPAGHVIGAKPAEFCRWIFDLLGAGAEDELVDLFPGSGAVGREWELYRAQPRLLERTNYVQEAIAV